MEKKTARLGALALGEGSAAVCAPVMGRSVGEIAACAAAAKEAGADMIELRIDSLAPCPDAELAAQAIAAAKAASGLPLLFTLRTVRDGGPGTGDAAAYEALLLAAVKANGCDGIDCELSVGEAAFSRIARAAHEESVCVFASAHEFGRLGDPARIARWYAQGEKLGADVCKAAVMADSGEEALAAALEMARAGGRLGVPHIAIVMGRHGVFTRVCCGVTGSCLTFASAGQASAPGQLDVKSVRQMLRWLGE